MAIREKRREEKESSNKNPKVAILADFEDFLQTTDA